MNETGVEEKEPKEEVEKKEESGLEKEYWATGKRKEAVARVRLIPHQKEGGKIVVNHRPVEDYFPFSRWQKVLKQPLMLTNSLEKYKIMVNVKGGGISGQAEAIRHGISRALLKADESLRPLLKKAGLLTRDPRKKERKKYGQRGARAKFQFTKR
ncbi:MAG: 30S ribosomal protein S9 [Candidatus Omnitrophota bacterium]|nr:MAG: 30S ribosomal protein S9 [Candidatus Omnitrophota bacterium]